MGLKQKRAVSPAELPVPTDFWKPTSLEKMADEQGGKPIQRLEEVLGGGGDLWRSDAELDEFLARLRERRRKGG